MIDNKLPKSSKKNIKFKKDLKKYHKTINKKIPKTKELLQKMIFSHCRGKIKPINYQSQVDSNNTSKDL